MLVKCVLICNFFVMHSDLFDVATRRDLDHREIVKHSEEMTIAASSWNWSHFWATVIDEYGFPLGKYFISFIYGIYRRFTVWNATIFLIKYVPTGLYMYRLLKSIYTTSRERIKQKQMELEDIQLQIQIVNTKQCVRDAEFTERAELLRRGAERLRAVRARVRDMIAADETLRRALDGAAPWGDEPELQVHSTPEEEREFIIALLKELKSEHVTISDRERPPEKMDCGEHVQAESTPDNSVYSSLSDMDVKQDCRVKIVKVTNVYKVAYLKHYIKQKRLRRATQQALLKKKIESIKRLLEGWQKSLNSVINNKILLDSSNTLDVASQEAMGDYSKPNLRESSDSDSDIKTNGTEGYYDEYSFNWSQNPYRNYGGFNYEEVTESAVAKDFYETQEFNDTKFGSHGGHLCECAGQKNNVLFILPEETSSQVAIEEIKSDACGDLDGEIRDIYAL